MLRISDHECFLEVEASVEEDSSIQSFGNARLSLRVQSHAFIGSSTVWVGREQLKQFSEDLSRLEKSLRGEAVLSSMSPGELSLKLLSVSSRGHVAIEGSIGRYVHSANSRFWHSVTFGFEFENTQLTEAVQLPWLSRGAA